MRHTATGWWLEEAGAVAPRAPLAADVRADVVIVGGGYAGMWTAWQLTERAPGIRVALLEAAVCGHGPSGRNGGFCETLWLALPALRRRFGDAGALRVARASSESVSAIEAWCAREGVDAWFERGGQIVASAAPAQDAEVRAAAVAAAELGAGDRVRELSAAEVAARCASPVLRAGVLAPEHATVQPVRLALGLRAALLERGVEVFEHTRVRSLRALTAGGVEARTAGGSVRAAAGVLAINAAARGARPLRGRLTVASSHIVLTEPVPDVLAQIGWTGGEAISDGRTFVHYFRTTRDGRIAFGWGGGRVGFGARLGGRIEVDAAVAAETARHLVRVFPALAGRRITHAWGGPIDVAPSHVPEVGAARAAPLFHAFGFTGNGVGPSHLAGRMLASLALGERDEAASLPLVEPDRARVPPEPLAWAGGSLVRAAHLRRERLEEAGRRVDPLTRAACAAPRAFGVHVGR